MCDPVSLTIGATAVAAIGQGVQGINQANQYRYQSRVAQANARMDQASARDAEARGLVEEERQSRRTAQLLGQQRVALAANGIETDFGSAGLIQQDTIQIGREDAATIRENTIREARGFEISAANQMDQSRAAKGAAKGALIGAAFDVGSTILSGASQVGKMKAGRAGRV